MLGDIRKGEAALSLGSLTTATSQKSTKPAITITVHRPEQNGLASTRVISAPINSLRPTSLAAI